MSDETTKEPALSELEQCRKEREEYLNGWKRAKADLINYQKDEARQLEELLKFANAGLIKELISVLDSFDLADNSKTAQNIEGMNVIRTQLESVLKKNGLEAMAKTVGQKFDPAVHESVGETDSDQPAGVIIEEAAKGYLLRGRIIRPARVKLSKGKGPLSL